MVQAVLGKGKKKNYGFYKTGEKQPIYESDSLDEALQYAVDHI